MTPLTILPSFIYVHDHHRYMDNLYSLPYPNIFFRVIGNSAHYFVTCILISHQIVHRYNLYMIPYIMTLLIIYDHLYLLMIIIGIYLYNLYLLPYPNIFLWCCRQIRPILSTHETLSSIVSKWEGIKLVLLLFGHQDESSLLLKSFQVFILSLHSFYLHLGLDN